MGHRSGFIIGREYFALQSRDEGAVVPIGSYQERLGVTLSLPSRVGRHGVSGILMPTLSQEEAGALDNSAATLRRAVESIEF